MAAQTNTFNEGMSKLKTGFDAVNAVSGLMGGTGKLISGIKGV